MSQSMPHTVSQDSTDGIRKRVCKACDRCRLKKSKCDGAHPCSRCKADNAICVFGERKKSHDKVYPKGYVEMLEQQQSQLVSGLQEMYKRLNIANAWTSTTLSETNGHPLTHDILAALDLLEARQDGSGDLEAFEEDCQKLQDRLVSEGAGYVQRRGSFSSDSDHSQRPEHSRNASHSAPAIGQAPAFRDSFSFGSATSSPIVQSPAQMKATHRPTLSFAVQPPTSLHLSHQNHFLSQSSHQTHQTHSPLSNDPQLYQPDWAIPDMSTPEQVLRTKLALQTSGLMQHHQPRQQQQPSSAQSSLHNAHRSALLHHHHHQQQASLQQQTNQSHAAHVLSQQQQQLHLHRQQQGGLYEPTAFDTGLSSGFVDTFPTDMQLTGFGSALLQNSAVDFSMDPMEMDFNKFISVTT